MCPRASAAASAADERQRALVRRRAPRRAGSRASVSTMPARPARVRPETPAYSHADGNEPEGAVGGEILDRDEAAALVHELEQLAGDGAA